MNVFHCQAQTKSSLHEL